MDMMMDMRMDMKVFLSIMMVNCAEQIHRSLSPRFHPGFINFPQKDARHEIDCSLFHLLGLDDHCRPADMLVMVYMAQVRPKLIMEVA